MVYVNEVNYFTPRRGYFPWSIEKHFHIDPYFTPYQTLKNKKNFFHEIFYAKTNGLNAISIFYTK
jgi:hypothetical protein